MTGAVDPPAVDGADAVAVVVALGRTVRAAGVPVTTGRLRAMVEALAVLDPTRQADVYWAGRATLCASREDLARYDAAFAAFFAGEAPHRRLRSGPPRRPPTQPQFTAPLTTPEDAEEDDGVQLTVGASRTEVLRQRDLATLSAADREVVNRMLAAMSLPGEPRRTRRHRPWARGGLDRRATVREAMHGLGDPRRLHRRRHRRRPRPVVLLVDVSGSMGAYADALLRFAHVAVGRDRSGRRAEAFTLGTRVTRITRELAHRDPDTAMAAVAGAIPDWAGGTRLGEGLKTWLDRWGQRGMARGAVVVVLSDGWERGDVTVLGEQMQRLHRLAHRVVWSNPRKAARGYEPLAGGMAVALPHVDTFVSGHSIAALERLARAVAGAKDGPTATETTMEVDHA